MAPTIAEQVQKWLENREEERCLERERATGKKLIRKPVAVPIVRVGPRALCQNVDHLMKVSEYDFDLSDSRFQAYCSARGTLHVAGEPGSTRWQWHADCSLSKDEYLANRYFQFAQEFAGTRQRYTPEDMEVQWKIILLGRATLQDCWELFQSMDPGNED